MLHGTTLVLDRSFYISQGDADDGEITIH